MLLKAYHMCQKIKRFMSWLKDIDNVTILAQILHYLPQNMLKYANTAQLKSLILLSMMLCSATPYAHIIFFMLYNTMSKTFSSDRQRLVEV